MLTTGPPTHSVGARLVTVAGVCRRLSSVVVVYNAAHMQRNSPGAERGGPVVLRPVRSTLCFIVVKLTVSSEQRNVTATSGKDVF